MKKILKYYQKKMKRKRILILIEKNKILKTLSFCLMKAVNDALYDLNIIHFLHAL